MENFLVKWIATKWWMTDGRPEIRNWKKSIRLHFKQKREKRSNEKKLMKLLKSTYKLY